MTREELYALSLPDFVRLLQRRGLLGSGYMEAQATAYLASLPGGSGCYSDGSPIPAACARYAKEAVEGLERSSRLLARILGTEPDGSVP